MSVHMKMHHTDAKTEIMLTVPIEDADKIIEAIQNLLELAVKPPERQALN